MKENETNKKSPTQILISYHNQKTQNRNDMRKRRGGRGLRFLKKKQEALSKKEITFGLNLFIRVSYIKISQNFASAASSDSNLRNYRFTSYKYALYENKVKYNYHKKIITSTISSKSKFQFLEDFE